MVVSLLVVGVVLWTQLPPHPHQGWPPPDSAAIDRGFVVNVLRRGIGDDRNGRKRGSGAHVEFLFPSSVKAEVYPVSYAQEKLCSLGAAAVEPLLSVLLGGDTEHDVRLLAALTLARLDDSRILPSFADAARRNLLTPRQVKEVLAVHLPFASTIYRYGDKELVEWLLNAETVEYGELRLRLLDQLIRLRFEDGGLFPLTSDIRVMRWLNRIFDEDIDDWLRAHCPEALAFRDAQLKKGYDPIVAFRCFCGNVEYAGVPEGCWAVLAHADERAACHKLIQVAYNATSPLYPPQQDGWLERLRAWYETNRARLVYDSARHRFVVKAPTSSVTPEDHH